MTIKVLLVCESPEENKRKMWAAEYNSEQVYPGGKRYVVALWGRIPPGRDKSVNLILKNFQNKKAQEVANDDAALAFIDKKVKEKASKGYFTVLYEHDGLPITFLCDNQPDEDGRIKMKTWDGKN